MITEVCNKDKEILFEFLHGKLHYYLMCFSTYNIDSNLHEES